MKATHRRPAITRGSALRRAVGMLATGPLLASFASGDVIFVDAGSGSATQNGASWATPFHALGPALSAAAANDQIWVAKGTYKPSGGQTASFLLKTNVDLFGGFENGDDSIGDADPIANPTILSGEIGFAFINADNCQHVVKGAAVSGVLIDGFSIIEGFADGSIPDSDGGAALFSSSTVEFQRCRFEINHAAGSGGAVGIFNSTVSFDRCIFLSNSAETFGGAVSANAGTAHLVNCRVLGNHAENGGGGVFGHVDSQLMLTNVAFSGNDAGSLGGAVATHDVVTIRHCSFGGNTSDAGADGLHLDVGSSGTVANCALGQNGTSDLHNDGAATITHTCVSSGAAPPGAGNLVANPKFRHLAGDDGVAGTEDDNLRLRGDSPCIDHGNTAAIPTDPLDVDGDLAVGETLPIDLEGKPRRLQDAVVPDTGAGSVPQPDLGAYEHTRPKTWFVRSGATGANDGTSWTDAFTTLEAALAAQSDPETGGPAEIWVTKGTYKPSTSGDISKSFEPGADAKVFGGFGGGELERSSRSSQNLTILSGAIGTASRTDNSRHVVVFDGASIDSDTVLDGFVITDGETSVGGGHNGHGGGILIVNGADPTIQNCRIVGNHANGPGGGVYSNSAAPGPLFINCVIASNESESAGGGCAMNACSFINCVVAANLADSNAPGGIWFLNGSAAVTIANSVFIDNTSNLDGEGAQLVGTAGMLLTHCIVQCYEGGIPGTAISSARPYFIDPNGADNVFGTPDDNYHVEEGSPTIDAGTASFLAGDPCDMDGDGITAESTPFDFDLDLRAFDDLGMRDGGEGSPPPDIGADEFDDETFFVRDPADLNGDGDVNGADITMVLGLWSTGLSDGDVNGDCIVNGADITAILGAWTG